VCPCRCTIQIRGLQRAATARHVSLPANSPALFWTGTDHYTRSFDLGIHVPPVVLLCLIRAFFFWKKTLVSPFLCIFQLFRGLKQADPTSPLLFDYDADALLIMIERVVSYGIIKGTGKEFVEGGLSYCNKQMTRSYLHKMISLKQEISNLSRPKFFFLQKWSLLFRSSKGETRVIWEYFHPSK
jgi:hypothetical protein